MQLRLSLTELDRRFTYLMNGKPYHGEAVNPKGLSVWESMMGFSKVCLHLRSPPWLLLLTPLPEHSSEQSLEPWR